MTGGRPTGTVTFLFTDIEGSTERWQSAPTAMATALERHDELLRAAVADRGGHVFATGGDGFAVAFERAADALDAAVAAQAALAAEPWPADATLRVRMGLHTGEVVERDGDFFGPAVNVAARVMAAGHGGQTLASATTIELAGRRPGDPGLLDLGEHHLRGVTAPVRVVQVGTEAFPSLRTEDRAQSNLPVQLTELVGRVAEVTEVAALAHEHRLITLAGPGGIGKTRLAVEVAAGAEPDHADGVWFVDLAAVSDDDDVTAATVTALGAAGLAPGPDALVQHLATRQLLLVLDNCEHVIDGVVELSERVLTGCRDVRLLCTSRELLDLAGEVVHWVAPLPVPEAGATSAAARSSPAVQLFEERAKAVRPEFSVDADSVDDVVEICRRLDGVPLAVELAAARVASMSVADIKERLDHRFRLLSGGRRRQDRHRTLQAAVGWSYDLLEPEAQRTFRHLAVFPGSFDLIAAAAVVGGDDLDVADAVSRLAERSLVVHDPAAGRYRLLETLRQYGLDRLAEAGETEPAQARFATHFLTLARREAPRFMDDGFLAADRVLRAEFDNLRGAAEWCTHLARWDALASLVVELWQYLIEEAPGDALTWLRAALDADSFGDEQLQYDAQWAMASLSIVIGDLDGSVQWSTAARRFQEAHSQVTVSPWSWHADCLVAAYAGDYGLLDELGRQMQAAAAEQGLEYARHFARCQRLIGRPRDDPGFDTEVDDVVAVAAATGSPLWMAVSLTCIAGGLFGKDGSPAGCRAAVALYEANPTALDAGGFMRSVLAMSKGLALSVDRPLDAVLTAVEGARNSDRLGLDYQRSQCLSALTLGLARAGLVELAARMDAHLRAGGDHGLQPAAWVVDGIDELVGDARFDAGPALLDRRGLFALLDEAEQAALAAREKATDGPG